MRCMYIHTFNDIIVNKGDDLIMSKDYELLIGKKFGDREILDIVSKKQRSAHALEEANKIKERILKRI